MTKNIEKKIYIGYGVTVCEEFKQVILNGLYTPYVISNFGRIFNLFFGKSYTLNIRELKPNSNSTEYVKITLHYLGRHYNRWIHILVAEAFIPNPKHLPEVNHIDGIKTNNFEWNLEWVTKKENMIHAEINHLTHHTYGEANHSKYSEKTIIEVCEMIMKNVKPKTIREITGVSKNTFSSVLHYRKWKHVTKKYDFSNYIYLKKTHKKMSND